MKDGKRHSSRRKPEAIAADEGQFEFVKNGPPLHATMDKHGRYAIIHLNDKPMIILDENGVTVRGFIDSVNDEGMEKKLEEIRAKVIE